LQRGLRFRQINILDVVQKVVAAMTGIALALAGFGYWALILPSVFAVGAASPALFLLAGFRPRFGFSRRRLRSCVRFSSGVFFARLLNFLGDDLDYFVLGKYLARPDYGFYYFAFTRTRLPYTLLGPAIQGPLLPAFSELRDDARRLRRAVVRVASVSFTIFAPIALAIAIFSDPLIPFVFSDRWAPAVPLCRVFAILTLLPAAGGFSGAVLLALGRSWTLVGFNAFRLAAIGSALVWGVLGSKTALEIAVSLTVANFLAVGTILFFLFRLIGLRPPDYVTMYGRAALCVVLAVAAWGGAFVAGLRPENLGPMLYLAAAGGLFLAAYGVATWWINRFPVDEVLPLVRDRVRRSRGGEG
jgi:O-antigen/teichoic acid export membrane protein